MGGYTARLGETTDVREAGGKGANLGRLIAAGFPVPDGFVVTADAYREFIDAAGLADVEPGHLREAIPGAEIPAPMARAILAAYAELGSPPVAVRSSGTAEDLAGASFAGQHDTYLNVAGDDAVLAAVLDCWASLWTPRAVAYRGERSWDERGLALAVVVQRMVDAEWAGVLFTADPVSGRRDRIVVEAVRGLGEALVSGEATGLHTVIDKRTRDVVGPRTAIPRRLLAELAALGIEAEERFGAPQDIEWTYADGRCALVQARPLTALPDEPAETPPAAKGARRSMGQFAVTADHMPYPPYPMDLSLIFRPAVGAILGGIRSAGFAVPALDEVIVEIDDGVVQIVPPRPRPTLRALVGVPLTAPKLIRLLRTKTTAWNARSEATLVPLVRRLDAEDLSGLGERELLDRALSPIHAVGALMPSRFAAVVPGMAADQILKLSLRLAFGRGRSGGLHDGLMSGIPSVTTASNAALERIAATVRATPELRELYLDGEPAEMAGQLRESAPGRALLAEIETYLKAYGLRALSMFTVGEPPLRDTPIVHGLLAGLARVEGDPDRDASDRLDQARVEETSGQDGNYRLDRTSPDDESGQGGDGRFDRPRPEVGPAGGRSSRFDRARSEVGSARGLRARLLRPTMARLLAPARDAVGFREDSHYALEMSLAVGRRALLELGGRLAARGLLAEADDIFYLELDELGRPDGAGNLRTTPGPRQLVERRRAARTKALQNYSIFPEELFERGAADGEVRGTPASRGKVTGTVRIIRDETEFGSLRAGQILVCPYTNPTWTPLFSLAAAVVVDSGGSTSHAAIVAREVGIPAIMGTGNGTRVLVDGQRVTVDADRGVVVVAG